MLSNSLPISAGIYKFFFVHAPELCYIGSTINLRQRLSQHLSDLRKNKHANRHLQFAFLKYGEDALCYEVVEEVERKEDLIIREQYYIDTLKPYYNILLIANNSLGSVRTPEHRAKLSTSHKGKTPWNKGKSMPPEIIAKLSASHIGKSSGRKGKKSSPETIARLKESLKGRTSWSKGITIPPDMLEQINAKKRTTRAARVARGEYVSHRKGITVPPEMRKQISETLLNKSPEEKAQTLEKIRANLAERTSEQEAQRVERRRATMAARYTDEEWSEIIRNARNLPPEAEAQRIERYKATVATRTPEQWAAITEKRLESMAANKAAREAEQLAQASKRLQALGDTTVVLEGTFQQTSLWDDESVS